jgi:hypothetical protein
MDIREAPGFMSRFSDYKVRRNWQMGKSIFIGGLLLSLIIFQQFALAESPKSPEELLEEHRKNFEKIHPQIPTNKPIIRGVVGKYQGIRLSDEKIVILDTATGRLWLWDSEKNSLTYQNQIQEPDQERTSGKNINQKL